MPLSLLLSFSKNKAHLRHHGCPGSRLAKAYGDKVVGVARGRRGRRGTEAAGGEERRDAEDAGSDEAGAGGQ